MWFLKYWAFFLTIENGLGPCIQRQFLDKNNKIFKEWESMEIINQEEIDHLCVY